ncbi:MAG TPA: adenylate/guanylate cyclase domain-containing protein [Verrucomicrobiae bacterium]|nr:adenylate/guanylate cyclase domain-containing protein [Verrucomicrobiae bacterium]
MVEMPEKHHSRISTTELAAFLKDVSSYDMSFSGTTRSCCIGIVDIVNSTATTAKLTNGKMCRFYSIFLNAMSKILRSYDATIIKNLGDSLLYYFPGTIDGKDRLAFAGALDCALHTIELRGVINQIMSESSLPPIDFRISCDYGIVSIASSAKSSTEDMFGPTVNLCSKINGAAGHNSLVIGGDMHQIVRSFKQYDYSRIGAYMLGLKLDYPVYTVTRTKSKWYKKSIKA